MQIPKKSFANKKSFFSPTGIYPDGAEFILRTEKLAKQMNLPLLTRKIPKTAIMVYGKDGLSLHHCHGGRIKVDFSNKKWQYRLARIQQEQLVKAMGKIKATDYLQTRIIDGTGGLGRDGFILAGAGFQVTIYEKNPIIAALLSDGLKRALAAPAIKEIAKRICLIRKDFLFIPTMAEDVPPDIIYLDPMFDKTNSKALVKKELQMIQQVVGQDNNTDRMFTMALEIARKRVVVKREKNGDWINHHPPSYSTTGKTIRFDIYLTA